jgi:hypothetical protein
MKTPYYSRQGDGRSEIVARSPMAGALGNGGRCRKAATFSLFLSNCGESLKQEDRGINAFDIYGIKMVFYQGAQKSSVGQFLFKGKWSCK